VAVSVFKSIVIFILIIIFVIKFILTLILIKLVVVVVVARWRCIFLAFAFRCFLTFADVANLFINIGPKA